MIMTRETWSTWKKPVPVPLCPQQIQHGLAWRNRGICGDRPETELPESWHDTPHTLFVHLAYSKRHFKSCKVAWLCTSQRYKLQVSRHVMFHCVSSLVKLMPHSKHQQWAAVNKPVKLWDLQQMADSLTSQATIKCSRLLTSFNLFLSGEGTNEHTFSAPPHHLPAA